MRELLLDATILKVAMVVRARMAWSFRTVRFNSVEKGLTVVDRAVADYETSRAHS